MQVLFLTLFLESIHNYTVYTYVFNNDVPLSRKTQLPLILITPIAVVAPIAATHYHDYIHDLTCWLNFDSLNAIVELLPNVILGCLVRSCLYQFNRQYNCSVLSSVRRPRCTRFHPIPMRTTSCARQLSPVREATLPLHRWRLVGTFYASVNVKSATGGWFSGVLFVHYTSLFLYTVATTFNVLLGVVSFR